MRDPQRIDRILNLINKIWSLPDCKDLRLTQLINAVTNNSSDNFYLEDSDLEEMLNKYLYDCYKELPIFSKEGDAQTRLELLVHPSVEGEYCALAPTRNEFPVLLPEGNIEEDDPNDEIDLDNIKRPFNNNVYYLTEEQLNQLNKKLER